MLQLQSNMGKEIRRREEDMALMPKSALLASIKEYCDAATEEKITGGRKINFPHWAAL